MGQRKIRTLVVADRKRLSAMIQKMAESFGDEKILEMISPEPTASVKDESKNPTIAIGIKLIKTLITFLESDCHQWFAELLGVTMDEFDKLPIDTEPDVLLQLAGAPEAERFFTTASSLSRKIKGYRELFVNKSVK